MKKLGKKSSLQSRPGYLFFSMRQTGIELDLDLDSIIRDVNDRYFEVRVDSEYTYRFRVDFFPCNLIGSVHVGRRELAGVPRRSAAAAR